MPEIQERRATRAKSDKLNALTSLRFIAAFAIVIHHCRPILLPEDFLQAWPLDHAVSFFFVLSGFILTHAYPELPSPRAVARFWAARFARLWPCHFVALLLALAISPSLFAGRGPLVANVLLAQSWIPSMNYFFSYNAVSWSISTEVGFYLLFPLLIANLGRTWPWKLAASAAVLVALICLCQFLPVPALDMRRPADFSSTGLLYINPLARLFEFTLGMCTALIWQRTRPASRTLLWMTIVEVFAIGVVLGMMRYGWPLLLSELRTSALPVAAVWAIHSGSCFALAFAVFALASGEGLIGRALSWSVAVFLGEISYAMYLVHQPMINAVAPYLTAPGVPIWLSYSAGLVVLLSLSTAMLLLIERPARTKLMKFLPFDLPSRVSSEPLDQKHISSTHISRSPPTVSSVDAR